MSTTNILIVEDEAIVAADIAGQLGRLGYAISGQAARGEDAVMLARNLRPDLVLMDIQLAGAMDGIEAAEVIHRECGVPVIYLTAHSDTATLERTKLTEPFGYILKPFEERELRTHIETALYRHQAERALRESEERFRMQWERMPIGCIVYDEQNRFSQINPAAEGIFGFSEMDLRGRHADAIVPESARPRLDSILCRLAKGDMTAHSVNENVTKDGRTIICDWTNTPLRDKNGVFIGFLSMVQDITERRRVEATLKEAHDRLEERVCERTAELERALAALGESEERIRTLANRLPNGAIYQQARMASGTWRFTFLSQGIESLHGVSIADALRSPEAIFNLYHPDDAGAMRAAKDESARSLTPFNFEGRIRLADGEIKWLHWRSSPRRLDGGGIVWDGVVTDISRRKADQAALYRANRALFVLKECSEALLRNDDEPGLLGSVCHAIVEIGGAKMAWVGFAEDDANKTVRPVASAGDEWQYIKHARATWSDTPHGRGPVGTAIRTHEIVVCRDITRNPNVKPWRKRMLQCGMVSVVALPLIWRERCLGVLAIYPSDPEAFDCTELTLFGQLAGNLAHGIVALRTRVEREQLQQELLTISEREKQLISQELHDGLCQNLAGTAMMCGTLTRRLALRQDQDSLCANQICAMLNLNVNEARNLSHGLHPVGPEGEGLMNALTELAGTVTNLFHIRCVFHCPKPVILENGPISTHLFRIAQEAINNARKHGEADEVRISLAKTARGIVLSVRDNGVGIPSDLSKKRGLGLKSMGYRATEIGATLSVRRGGRKGTLVSCILPACKNAQ